MSIVLGLHDLQLGRAIRVGIDEQGLLEVVGAASTAEGLVELAGLVRSDVILVDEVLASTELHPSTRFARPATRR